MSKNSFIFILISLLIVALFGLKDILILNSTVWPHLYPVVNTTPMTFEEVYCYLPFLSHFSLTNLLPAAPMAILGFSKFTFFPPITIIMGGILFKWLCFANIDIYLLIAHVLFPLLSFWLIVLIFRRYISTPWAILLAFWGVTFCKNFSFLGYFFHVIFNPADVIKSATLTPLEITRSPFPNLSLFFFLLCFYLSTLTYKISLKRYVLLTILWSINLYVYLHNFVAGMMFWFSYIIFTQYLTYKSFKIRTILKTLVVNILVVGIVISPVIIRLFLDSGLDKEIIRNLGPVYRDTGFIFNQWGVLLSYVLPLVLTIIVISFYCLDYYELFYRFMPIFIMIGVELIMLNLHLILGSFFQPDLFSIRIGNFFSLYLYFIPVIYFFSAPMKQISHNKIINKVAGAVHSFFKGYIIRYQVFICIFGIIGAAFLVTTSSLKYYNNHDRHAAPRMRIVQQRIERLIETSGDQGTLVSDNIPVNLLLPILSRNTSLFVSSFSNYIHTGEILDRLVLFAHIYKWDEERFLDFMMPNELQRLFYTDNNFLVSDDFFKNGFGYWLAWHRREMDKEELERYRRDLLYRFKNIDLREALSRYKVTGIQAIGEIDPAIPVKVLRIDNGTRLYTVIGK